MRSAHRAKIAWLSERMERYDDHRTEVHPWHLEADAERVALTTVHGGPHMAGRHCPHCGSVASSALRGRTCRPGLYQCRDCRLQFTVTTLAPMHATKLDLRLWICAMFLVRTSSKGISSVVLARLLGVNLEADPGSRPDAPPASRRCRQTTSALKGLRAMLAVTPSSVRFGERCSGRAPSKVPTAHDRGHGVVSHSASVFLSRQPLSSFSALSAFARRGETNRESFTQMSFHRSGPFNASALTMIFSGFPIR